MISSFKIRAYGRTELAQAYCPELSGQGAYLKLNDWIDRYPGLREALQNTGLNPKKRSYTPAQVKLIVDALGEP